MNPGRVKAVSLAKPESMGKPFINYGKGKGPPVWILDAWYCPKSAIKTIIWLLLWLFHKSKTYLQLSPYMETTE